MNRRELCRFCNRKVDVLSSGRLAYHHYVAPGIGIPCPAVPAADARWVCAGCARDDMETDEYGRLPLHYINPNARSNVRCKGAGRLPGIAA